MVASNSAETLRCISLLFSFHLKEQHRQQLLLEERGERERRSGKREDGTFPRKITTLIISVGRSISSRPFFNLPFSLQQSLFGIPWNCFWEKFSCPPSFSYLGYHPPLSFTPGGDTRAQIFRRFPISAAGGEEYGATRMGMETSTIRMGENLDLLPTFTRNCRIISIRNIRALTVSTCKTRKRIEEGQLSGFSTSNASAFLPPFIQL